MQGVTPDRGVVTRWADVPQSAYVPSERVKAMDADGIDAHSFYPNVGNVQTLNNPKVPEALRLEALRACNEIQIEEYVQPYPGRFIALAVVPLWDPAKAVDGVPLGRRARHEGRVLRLPAAVRLSRHLRSRVGCAVGRTPGGRSCRCTSTSAAAEAWEWGRRYGRGTPTRCSG